MYHGYATHNFLDIDQHFGTKEDFQDLVKEARQLHLYVIPDIVVNHAAQVFLYDTSENSESQLEFNPAGSYPVKSWTDRSGQPVAVDCNRFSADDAIWPVELKSFDNFNRRSCIGNWEDEDQHLHGNFKLLKDFKLVDSGRPSLALQSCF